jgi:hypothetical protein
MYNEPNLHHESKGPHQEIYRRSLYTRMLAFLDQIGQLVQLLPPTVLVQDHP